MIGKLTGTLLEKNPPQLLIDCGQEALTAYLARYGQSPRGIFITHLHLDHRVRDRRVGVVAATEVGQPWTDIAVMRSRQLNTFA